MNLTDVVPLGTVGGPISRSHAGIFRVVVLPVGVPIRSDSRPAEDVVAIPRVKGHRLEKHAVIPFSQPLGKTLAVRV